MASVPFNNLITFSRGSNATLTGSNGLIQWAPSNLLTFSEQFDNAAWTKVLSASATANTDTAPDGTTTADTVVAGASNSAVRQTVTTQADSYTFSCWVKRKTGTGDVQISASGGSWVTQSLTTSWQRFSVTQSLSAGSNFPGVRITTSGDEVYVWGAQVELGSAATTYNSTTVKNRLGFSEAFDNAAWTKGGASIVTGAQANPVNGAFNGQKLMENTAAATQHYVAQILSSLVAATPITLSVYAKAGERRYIGLLEGFSNKGQYFDLQTGTVGSVLIGAPTSASITAVGNGWYRCAITTPVASTTASLEVYLSNSGASISYTGDGNSGVYIYGAQLSDSASLDPYVPTPAAAPSSTAYYGPRFDYDPVTLAPKGLLVEEARTNLLIYSEEFDNAAWVKTRSTVTANQAVAPNGSNVADLFVEDTSTGGHEIYKTAVTTAAAHTFSMYAKLASGTRDLTLYPQGTTVGWAIFNLATGVITASGGAALLGSSITAVGNGWYRCSVTWTASATTTFCACYTTNSTAPAPSYTGDGTSGFYLYGAQLEAGAFATSYIPTVASTVTRSADVANMTGSLFSQWYGKTQGSFVFTGSWMKPSGGQIYVLSNGSSNRYIYDGNSAVLTTTGQSFDGTNVLASNVDVNGTLKIASAYQTGVGKAIAVNGSAVATGAYDAAAWSVNTALKFGETFYNGHIRSIDYIPARAADFQLQVLST